MTRVRVLVADSHPLARLAMTTAVHADARLELAGEAESGREATAVAREVRPDVALIDAHMPDLEPVEIARAFRRELPSARLLFVAASIDGKTAYDLLASGATGVLEKGVNTGLLRYALVQVAEGRIVLDSHVQAVLVQELRGSDD